MVWALVTGARGMLGTALLSTAPETVAPTGVDLEDGDLSQPEVGGGLLLRYQPQVVIHCAAMTDVDGCTREPERAMLHNGTATRRLAEACAAVGARLLYISTDYVFPGDLGRPYVETDEPRPLNPYGESKLAGERAVAELRDHVIVRTQWLYGPGGRNFIATIVKAARPRNTLRVVSDEFGSPTYVRDLAPALWRAALAEVRGILHVTNSGVCCWADLARLAVAAAGLDVTVEPITAAEWGSITVRPRYSPLANRRWVEELGYPPLRPWQEPVTEYVSEFLRE